MYYNNHTLTSGKDREILLETRYRLKQLPESHILRSLPEASV